MRLGRIDVQKKACDADGVACLTRAAKDLNTRPLHKDRRVPQRRKSSSAATVLR